MMSKLKNWLATGRFKSLCIVVFAFIFQAISWLVMFGAVVSEAERSANAQEGIVMSIMAAISVIWFFIPLFSLLGIAAGIAYQRRHGRSYVAIAGVILNGLWFLGFLLVCFLVFVIGVTA